jgi:hypothetical protein
MRSAVVIAILLFASANARAFESGREFLEECGPSATKVFSQLSPDEQLMGMSCGGYLKGFIGAIRLAETGTRSHMICSPADIEIRQALKLSVAWMNDHSDELDKPATQLIFRALVDAFPCSGKRKQRQQEDEEQDEDQKELSL